MNRLIAVEWSFINYLDCNSFVCLYKCCLFFVYVEMLRDKSVDSLRAVLAAQVVHKNSLICAVQLSEICHQMKEMIPSTHR